MSLTAILTLPVIYSKLTMSPGSKGSSWLPPSPPNLKTTTTLIPSPKCKQQPQKPAESTITLTTDKQVLEDLKAAIQARLDLTDDNQAHLSLG
jgi:hypothetical protein